METLIPHIRQHFDAQTLKLGVFRSKGTQVESWFKGELLALFAILERIGIVSDIDREVTVPEGRVDMRLRCGGRTHWVELKHFLVGVQAGQNWRCVDYMGAHENLARDAEKLCWRDPADGWWVMVLMTSNPGKVDWEQGLAVFRSKFKAVRLVTAGSSDHELTRPDDFPGEYFLAVARVERNAVVSC